jgi:hypothetical protein
MSATDLTDPPAPSATPSPDPKTALLKLALFAAEELILHAPELFAEFKALFERESVTIEDLRAERAAQEAKHYKDLVPATQIPPEQQT